MDSGNLNFQMWYRMKAAVSSTVYVSFCVERICFGKFLCAAEFDVSRVKFRASLFNAELKFRNRGFVNPRLK